MNKKYKTQNQTKTIKLRKSIKNNNKKKKNAVVYNGEENATGKTHEKLEGNCMM